MSKRVPTFRSDEEAASFWEAHDSTDYLADLPIDTGTIFVRPEARVIQVTESLWRAIADAAKRQRTTPARLVSRLLRTGLPSIHAPRRAGRSAAKR
jgi:hypothetical protein